MKTEKAKDENVKDADKSADLQKRLFRRSVASFVFSLVMLIAVIGFSLSYGWFSLVRDVFASDMTVGTKKDLFDLAVSGEQISHFAADSPVLSYLAEEENGGYEKLPSTQNGHGLIVCNLINDNPLVTGTEELSPGSFGRISFDIIPGEEVSERFTVSFDRLSLKEDAGTVGAVDDSDLEELKALFSGHILFFASRSSFSNGGYYYSGHLDGDSFEFDLSEHTPVTVDGKDRYTVEFYWIWPMTFSQLAYPQNDPRLHTHALSGDETTRTEMIAYVKAHPELFFKGLDPSVDLNLNNFDSYYFVELSEAYNTADQFIGEKANYLALKISVIPEE